MATTATPVWKDSYKCLTPPGKWKVERKKKMIEDVDSINWWSHQEELPPVLALGFEKEKHILEDLIRAYSNHGKPPLFAEPEKMTIIILEKWYQTDCSVTITTTTVKLNFFF